MVIRNTQHLSYTVPHTAFTYQAARKGTAILWVSEHDTNMLLQAYTQTMIIDELKFFASTHVQHTKNVN